MTYTPPARAGLTDVPSKNTHPKGEFIRKIYLYHSITTATNYIFMSDDALTLKDMGIEDLESVEAIVPSYLWRFRPYGEFHKPSEA